MSIGPAHEVELSVVCRTTTALPSAPCCSTSTWAASVCASVVIDSLSLSFVAAIACNGTCGIALKVWSFSAMCRATVRNASSGVLEATS